MSITTDAATAERRLTEDITTAHDALCALGVECPAWLNAEGQV